MPALIAGFCRNSAASKVEPDLGNPEMKWWRGAVTTLPNCQLIR